MRRRQAFWRLFIFDIVTATGPRHLTAFTNIEILSPARPTLSIAAQAQSKFVDSACVTDSQSRRELCRFGLLATTC